eukprot:3535644-Rhodomonas_salina.4
MRPPRSSPACVISFIKTPALAIVRSSSGILTRIRQYCRGYAAMAGGGEYTHTVRDVRHWYFVFCQNAMPGIAIAHCARASMYAKSNQLKHVLSCNGFLLFWSRADLTVPASLPTQPQATAAPPASLSAATTGCRQCRGSQDAQADTRAHLRLNEDLPSRRPQRSRCLTARYAV